MEPKEINIIIVLKLFISGNNKDNKIIGRHEIAACSKGVNFIFK